jgi:hypothetical protein
MIVLVHLILCDESSFDETLSHEMMMSLMTR